MTIVSKREMAKIFVDSQNISDNILPAYYTLFTDVLGRNLPRNYICIATSMRILESSVMNSLKALQLKYGLTDGNPLTLKEVAAKMDISPERVRQHIKKCLDILKLRYKEFVTLSTKERIAIDDLKTKLSSSLPEYLDNNTPLDIKAFPFKQQRKYPIRKSFYNLVTIGDYISFICYYAPEEATSFLEDVYKANCQIGKIVFNPREFNALYKAGIRTDDYLLSLSYEDLLKIDNIGRHSASKILAKINEYK